MPEHSPTICDLQLNIARPETPRPPWGETCVGRGPAPSSSPSFATDEYFLSTCFAHVGINKSQKNSITQKPNNPTHDCWRKQVSDSSSRKQFSTRLASHGFPLAICATCNAPSLARTGVPNRHRMLDAVAWLQLPAAFPVCCKKRHATHLLSLSRHPAACM